MKISSQTPIFGSIEDGDEEESDLVLRENPDAISERNKNGWSPLHQACFSDRAEFARKLVELVGEENRVAYINAPCKDGDTPLHYAACQDAVSCVEFFTLPKRHRVRVERLGRRNSLGRCAAESEEINKGKIRKNSNKQYRRGGDDDDVIERGKKFLKRILIFLALLRAIVSVSFVKIK